MKIILGDNSIYPWIEFGTVKFDLDYGKLLILHEVIYVLELKKKLIYISSLEDKRMRIVFINGKVLTWPKGSRIKDSFILVSRVGGLYTVTGRPLLETIHDTNHQN